ncbi:MAG: heme ABC exporter ATP-binding protein CcmA [Gemmatimonadota bacterium]
MNTRHPGGAAPDAAQPPHSTTHLRPRSRPGPAIRARSLSKRFGWKWALRDVDLDVAAGSSLALVGPNGAGKTTLLRLTATFFRPSTGEVEVFGHSVRSEADAVRRRTGLLTASGVLYDDLTARENLRFATMMAGERPDLTRISAVLERVQLSEVADLRVRGFSTGMRKRLELARLLMRPLDLILLDEPYISLDVEGVALIDQILAQLRARGGTVVFASHKYGEAVRSADRIAALREGRLEAVGSPEDVAHALPEGAIRTELLSALGRSAPGAPGADRRRGGSEES